MKIRKLSIETYDAIKFDGENATECIKFLGDSYREHFSVGGFEEIHFLSCADDNIAKVGNYILRRGGACESVTERYFNKNCVILTDTDKSCDDHF